MKTFKKSMSGWGNYPIKNTHVISPNTLEELTEIQKTNNLIARGNGRSYGDCSYSPGLTVDMRAFNKILQFDEENGIIEVEAGVLLSDIIYKYIPKGWFPVVSPGTKFVTIGGMVASDVHGKNHHKDGSFSNCINWFDLLTSSNQVVRCSKEENAELFEWTVGGMGLTGIITRVSFSLKKIETSWISVTNIANKNLHETFEAIEQYNNADYSVAWIDSTSSGKHTGKSILMIGDHASSSNINNKNTYDISKKKKITFPFFLPNFFLRRFLIKIFNFFYYIIQKRKGTYLSSWDNYFYPLDNINEWNRIYGKRGFFQIQCVFPLKYSKHGVKEILEQSSRIKHSSFLTVLKKFKDQKSNISFPMSGYTITLDYPVNDNTKSLVPVLEKIVLRYRGRFYLTKDSVVSQKTFKESDDRLHKFKKFRERMKLTGLYKSYLSSRLDI
tara:strand:+ start:2920 stop:4245 length:1326 start_codon:yes stop_codon:yes gene_type:complete